MTQDYEFFIYNVHECEKLIKDVYGETSQAYMDVL